MFINKVTIYGNIARDLELKKLPSGSSVLNTSVATNRVWKDQKGDKKEEVEFHNIVVFGKQAELMNQYLSKGSGVLVEGRLQTRSWEADGAKKYMTEIIADRIQFGPKSSGGGSPKQTSDINPDLEKSSNNTPTKSINPDDIPF